MTKEGATISPMRLRLGVTLLLLWLLPFWLAGPYIADALGLDSPKGASTVSLAIAVIQTIIGILGVVIAGKEVTAIVKGLPLRKMPRKVIHILWTGDIDTSSKQT